MRRTREHGFTLIELLIVVAIIGIIAAIAIPSLMRARMASNEASAIGSMRAISSAQSAYTSSCGGGGYAPRLEALAAPAIGGNGFISPDLASTGTVKSGYVVNLAAGSDATVVLAQALTCNNVADAVASFFAEAHPSVIGGTGTRSFGTDNRGTIFQDPAGATFTLATLASSTTALQ